MAVATAKPQVKSDCIIPHPLILPEILFHSHPSPLGPLNQPFFSGDLSSTRSISFFHLKFA